MLKRLPSSERRTAILAAARKVIACKGLARTRMRDIALAAQVSLGTLTYHFQGIEEILVGALEQEMLEFYKPWAHRAQEGTGEAGLRTLVDGFLASDDRTRDHWLLWLDFWALAAHTEPYAGWQVEIYQRWRADVTHQITRGVADGSLRRVEIDRTADEFMALFDGVAAHAYLPGRGLEAARARALMHDFIDTLAADRR